MSEPQLNDFDEIWICPFKRKRSLLSSGIPTRSRYSEEMVSVWMVSGRPIAALLGARSHCLPHQRVRHITYLDFHFESGNSPYSFWIFETMTDDLYSNCTVEDFFTVERELIVIE